MNVSDDGQWPIGNFQAIAIQTQRAPIDQSKQPITKLGDSQQRCADRPVAELSGQPIVRGECKERNSDCRGNEMIDHATSANDAQRSVSAHDANAARRICVRLNVCHVITVTRIWTKFRRQ
jgi:hypothetical protein